MNMFGTQAQLTRFFRTCALKMDCFLEDDCYLFSTYSSESRTLFVQLLVLEWRIDLCIYFFGRLTFFFILFFFFGLYNGPDVVVVEMEKRNDVCVCWDVNHERTRCTWNASERGCVPVWMEIAVNKEICIGMKGERKI